MFNPKLALSLSFFYCGLGQLYKHEILKGIVLIFIYTMLIASLLFFSVPIWLLGIGMFLTFLLWTVNLLDAYLNTGGLVNDDKGFILEPLLSNSTFFIACLVSVYLAIFWVQFTGVWDKNYSKDTEIYKVSMPAASSVKATDYSMANLGNKINDDNEKSVSANNKTSKLEKDPKPDKLYQIEVTHANSKFYSLQVGAFQILENAKGLYNEMTSKGYQVWIEPPNQSDSELYCVLVGEFKGKRQANLFGKKLLQQEGMKYAVVIRLQMEKIKFTKEEKIAYSD